MGLFSRGRLALLAALLLSPTAATPCAYDGLLGNGISAVHPKSIEVAVAVRHAIEAGIVQEATIMPAAAGNRGYFGAVHRLAAFANEMSSSSAPASVPAPILLIDSGMWSWLTPTEAGLALKPHVSGPRQGDVVIVTSEGVIAAMQAGRLSARQAITDGLVALDGLGPLAQAIRTEVLGLHGNARLEVKQSRTWLFCGQCDRTR